MLQLNEEENPTQVLSCEICEIFKNNFFYRTPPVATFETKHTHASAADLLHIRIESLDWNESYEKETKHINASATSLLHVRIGNLDWCKCGHCRNKAREIDYLRCREADAMLIASAKTHERGEASRHAAFMGNCPTVSHMC